MRHSIWLAGIALAFAAPAFSAEILVNPSEGAERLVEAFVSVAPGDTIVLGEGRFDLTEGLSLDAEGVTIKGAGPDKTVLSFKDQTGSGEGLLVTSNKVVLKDFAVEDTKGDGVKSKGSDQISFLNLRVEWTNGPDAKNGAYGVYPVSSKNVLIDGVTVKGASDAGIYVGQSDNIIVRNSTASLNVAGIEIENSYRADVYGNTATHNTGGILIFDLPNLPQMGGRDIRVFGNTVVDNDTPNFAPKGNIVAMVPKGLGVLVMANRNVHVFDNRFDNNATTHVAVISYPLSFDDKTYGSNPRGVVVRDNAYGKAGYAPEGEVGQTFADVAGLPLPDVLWDGVTPLTEWLTWTAAEDRVYVNETDGSFANLKMISNFLFPWKTAPDRRIGKYAGALPEPAPVKLPQEGGAS
ncbi:MAG: right-handed parallel beta-helix repeat-containing protein [Phyllobacteriaceae bacterium]|nr:right-handed parallel beta-helix repeat-containing protein [Phyllobacteriaceae bacterium]